MFMASVQIPQHFLVLRVRQACNLVVHTAQAIVGVHTKLCKEFFVFRKGIFIKDFDGMAKNDGV